MCTDSPCRWGRTKWVRRSMSAWGPNLLVRAEEIARSAGYRRLAVIAAVGTRRYYEKRGFKRGDFYLVKEI